MKSVKRLLFAALAMAALSGFAIGATSPNQVPPGKGNLSGTSTGGATEPSMERGTGGPSGSIGGSMGATPRPSPEGATGGTMGRYSSSGYKDRYHKW